MYYQIFNWFMFEFCKSVGCALVMKFKKGVVTAPLIFEIKEIIYMLMQFILRLRWAEVRVSPWPLFLILKSD